MQSPEASVPSLTRASVLRRCSQLPKLEAILLHLLAADERATLPLPPLSSASAAAPAARRRNAADWAGAEDEEQGIGLDASAGKLGKSQQRAAKAYRCVTESSCSHKYYSADALQRLP
jgi:hypothetical protein